MLCTGVIVGLTLVPASDLPNLKMFSYDKIGHFLMFAGWTYLFGIVKGLRKNSIPNLWEIFAYGTIFGILIEFMQEVMPFKRSGEVMDIVVDSLGAGFAVIFVYYTLKRYFISEKISH